MVTIWLSASSICTSRCNGCIRLVAVNGNPITDATYEDDRAKGLADREFIAGEYSIADMAAYPWIVPWKRQQQNLDDFPNLRRWFETIRARPAVVRAYRLAEEINTAPTVTDESRALLFGQTAAQVGK